MSINALRNSGRAVGAVIGTACLLLGVAPAAAGTVTAARADTPPGAPPGVCPADTGWGPPLPGTALSASRVQSGFQFLEGPVWVADPGYLLVSDLAPATGAEQVQPSTIRRLVPPAAAETFVANAGSNGLALTPDGQRILAATHDNRAVSAFQLSDRARSVVAADYQGRAFNSPNDVTVRADGVVYFTDPSFQRGRRPDAMGGRTGVFRVVNGQVALVDNSVRQPNGIALSPDGSTLYVGAFGENRIYAYQVRPDGSTGQRTVFATIASPDGVTVDCAGNVYWVSPSGAALGTISSGTQATNAAFGATDRRTLYITAGRTGDYGIYSIQLGVPGYPY